MSAAASPDRRRLRAAADFLGSAQPFPPVPRGAGFPVACRKPGAAAACWPPNRRWQFKATAAAGRNTVNRLCIDLAGRVSEPCTRDNVKESYLDADRSSGRGAADRRGPGRRHLRLDRSTMATARRASTFDCAEPVNLRVRYGRTTVATVDVSERGGQPARLHRDRGARHLHRRPRRQRRLRRRKSGPADCAVR